MRPGKSRPGEAGVRRGQSTLEFCFALILFLFLIFALIQAMRWVVMEKVEMRYDFEKDLTTTSFAESQLNPHAHPMRVLDMELFTK